MVPEYNLPPNFHLPSAFCFLLGGSDVRFKSTTLTSYHDLKTKGTSPTCLPCRPFPLLPISRRLSGGSLKVNPRQELSDPPMLVRKVSVKPKDGQKLRTLRRGCGVSFTLSFSRPFFFLLSSVSRCDLVACYRKETVHFSLLLLSWCSHSPPPIFRSPSKRTQPGSLQMRALCRSASIHFIDRCVCVFLLKGGLYSTVKQPCSVYVIKTTFQKSDQNL